MSYLCSSPLISLVAQSVKSLPAMQETQVQSLGWKDPLEKEMATHSVFLPGEFHKQRRLVGYSPWGHKESDTTMWLTLDSKETKPVSLTGNQSWIFTGRTDGEAETPILWPLDEKNWLFGTWCWEGWNTGERDDRGHEMVGWHHWLNGQEFEHAPGDGEGQGSLVSCSPWDRKEWTWLHD